MSQLQLFSKVKIGDIITSKLTGNKIQVIKIRDSLVVGKLIGYVFTDRSSTDVRILSYENIE